MKHILSLATLVLWMPAAYSQSTIAYVHGPSFGIAFAFFVPQTLDLNGDGSPDFTFESTIPLCTTDYPTSACAWWYYAGAAGTNQLLASGYYTALQPFGAWVGSNAPSGASWSAPGYNAELAGQWWNRYGRIINGQIVYSGWDGPLSTVGVGYLAVRFYAADGLHYGWVRVRLPGEIVDWAYETRPNTPIRAGVIGTSSQSLQLTADVGGGTGTFILTGNTLRSELILAGQFSSANIRGPSPPRSNAKPAWNFDSPLAARGDYTAFFGEVGLSHGQITQLLRGAYYVDVADGALLGRILW